MFKIRAVDSQAKAILQTIKDVRSQLDSAKLTLQQKSALLTNTEKSMIDATFAHTEQAIQQVSKHAERARSDIYINGKVGFNTRLLCTLRDSPGMHVGLTQLGIATQSLNFAVALLLNREDGVKGVDTWEGGGVREDDSRSPCLRSSRDMQRPRSAQSMDHRHSYASSFDTQSPLWLSEKELELELALNGTPHSLVETIPAALSVHELDLDKQMDPDLFQQANCFTPVSSRSPVSSPYSPSQTPAAELDIKNINEYPFAPLEHAWTAPPLTLGPKIKAYTPPPLTFTPPIEETRVQARPRFYSSPPRRPRSWSGRAIFQADELGFDMPSSPPCYVSSNKLLSPAQRPLASGSRKARDELWF